MKHAFSYFIGAFGFYLTGVVSFLTIPLTPKGEIIHAQWWSYVLAPVYFMVLSVCKIRKKKLLLTVHNVIPHETTKLNQFLNGIILYFGDKFITHTERNKEKLSDTYCIPKEKIYVIPLGLLRAAPIKGISRKEAREYLSIPDDKKVILLKQYTQAYCQLNEVKEKEIRHQM